MSTPDPERLAELRAYYDDPAQDLSHEIEAATWEDRLARRVFVVKVDRAKQPEDEALLVVSIPEIDRVTVARSLSEVEIIARAMVGVALELPKDSFDITVKAPPGLPSVTVPEGWSLGMAEVRSLAEKRGEMLKALDEEMAMRTAAAQIVAVLAGLAAVVLAVRAWRKR